MLEETPYETPYETEYETENEKLIELLHRSD